MVRKWKSGVICIHSRNVLSAVEGKHQYAYCALYKALMWGANTPLTPLSSRPWYYPYSNSWDKQLLLAMVYLTKRKDGCFLALGGNWHEHALNKTRGMVVSRHLGVLGV